jgi:DNA repair exonuclease SbcCD ATPase subunit
LIRSISIRNFQSHASTDLELGAFTAITGLSSSGKTAVIRALKWVMYGAWDKTFPGDPEVVTSVALAFQDGTTVTRIRKGDSNTATIDRPGQPQVAFRDFGEVIPGMFDLANVRPIEMNDKRVNLNVADQDDPLFLVSPAAWSRPGRAQWLGRLYGAHVVNTVLRIMAKDRLEAEKLARAAEKDVESLGERIKAYSGLDDQEAAVLAAEGLQVKVEALSKIKAVIADASTKAATIRSRGHVLHADTRGIKAALVSLAGLLEIRESLRKSNIMAASLSKSRAITAFDVGMAREAVRSLSALRDVRTGLESARKAAGEISAKKHLKAADLPDIRLKLECLGRLREMASGMAQATKKLAAASERHANRSALATQAKEAVRLVMSAGGGCPVCGGSELPDPDKLAANLKVLVGG